MRFENPYAFLFIWFIILFVFYLVFQIYNLKKKILIFANEHLISKLIPMDFFKIIYLKIGIRCYFSNNFFSKTSVGI